ncbi:MAG: hypothetical protein WBV39_07630 [Rudaea sp.]
MTPLLATNDKKPILDGQASYRARTITRHGPSSQLSKEWMMLFTRTNVLRGLHVLCAGSHNSVAAKVGVPSPATPSATTLAPVSVTGAANAAEIRYRDLLAGVAAFKKYRHYAPDATLSFYLAPRSKIAASPALILQLQTAGSQIDVPVAENGQFALPTEKDAGGDDGYLVANRAAGTVGVVPTVRSAGDTDTVLRLGDLRLQCEVSWAIEKQNVPKAIRSFFFLAGRMCHSSRIAVNYFHAVRKLRKALLIYAGRQVNVVIAQDGHTYRPPLGDTKWPDDALVMLTFDDVIPATNAP